MKARACQKLPWEHIKPSMSSEGIKIYSYRRCPFAMRVRLTLHEKGLKFETVEEDLKNFSEDIRRHHPEAKVPVLLHGGAVLYESAVITEYLDETFPQPSLMPKDPKARAAIRLWTYWCNHHFKHHIDAFKYGESRCTPEQVKAAPVQLSEDLKKLEAALAANTWIMG